MQREKLILRYGPLVKHAVGSLAAKRPSLLDAEDIYSYGTMGLIDAIDRYDASRGVKFETYAVTRIRGYLLDQLRSLDPLSRSARAQVRTVQRTTARMEERLGRRPDREELAEATGLSAVACDRALAEGGCQVVSLDRLSTGDDDDAPVSLLHKLVDEQSPNPALTTERAELCRGVAAAMVALPEREREVLSLRYVQNWTLKQIAVHLAISESRVSQLHAQALGRMRRNLIQMFGEMDAAALSA
jgi:RNA polymerase sigma factor for flagellar operon FliA